ncbi:MAG: mechanosensitive ion channel domain-containing protein [Gemmatimonadota bacterium]
MEFVETIPFFDQLLTGSGLLYAIVGLLALLILIVHGRSHDRHLRQRALFVVALLALFVVLRIALGWVPPRTSGFVAVPGSDATVPGLVPNPAFQALSVIVLSTGLLAFLLTLAMLVVDFLMVRKLRVEIPNILRDVALIALFFFGILFILTYRTDLDITGLLGTSAIISIVIGLALQDTLGNVFSGLALQTERSFNVGDWVRFGEREGIVTDISWRATKLQTRSNDLVIIPNSQISKDIVINYSAPTRVHAVLAIVGAHYRHTPASVIAAIQESSDQTPGILLHPKVDIRTYGFGDFAVNYQVKYWIKDYADLEDISDDFMTRIWYAFSRHGIEIPFPIRNVYLHEVTSETERAEAQADDARIYGRLRQSEIFEPLADEEVRALATRARVVHFFAGETVLQQGAAGDSLYVLDEGMVEVVVEVDGRTERLAELTPPAVLGEMALLTGAERSATVVTRQAARFFVIDRGAFRATLEHNPELAERLSDTLARRQRELEQTHAALHEAAAGATEETRGQILSRIRGFFGFGGTESR